MIKLQNLFFIVFCFISTCLSSKVLDGFGLPSNERIRLREINSSMGLAQDIVKSVFQDKQGFMWFGTMNGLSRYDGMQFINYYFDETDPNSLSSNSIREIKSNFDSTILYISTSKGFNFFDLKSNKFSAIFNQVNDTATLTNSSCFSSSEDSEKRIWIGCWGNAKNEYVNIIENGQKKVTKVLLNNTGKIEAIHKVFTDHNNQIWVGTRRAGLYRINNKNGRKIENYCTSNGLITNDNVTSIFEDKEKRLFILTYKGIEVYDKTTNSFKVITPKVNLGEVPISKRSCYGMIEDEFHNLWVGTDSGVYIINSTLDKCRVILPSPTNEFGLKHPSILNLYIDRYNNIWICTQLGVFLYNKNNNQFGYINVKPKMTNPTFQLNFSHTRIMEGIDKTIWIALDHKYVHFFPNTNKFVEVDDNYIKNKFPMDLAVCDSKGNCLIRSLNSNGVYFRKANTQKVIHLTYNSLNPKSINDSLVSYIYLDKRDKLWILTNDKGLGQFNPDSITFKRYTFNDADTTSVINNYFYDAKSDYKNRLWFCSWLGLQRYNPNNDNFRRYLNNVYSTIYTIFPDKNYLWLGTTNGLVKFNPDNGQIERTYTIKDGLLDNSIHGILMDDKQNLWVSTPKGISCIDFKLEKINSFFSSDGLQSKNFLHEAYLKASDGTMYFGGIDGVNFFKPEDINVNQSIPDVAITRILVLNKPIQEYYKEKEYPVANYVKKIELSYKDYMVIFEYVALHFLNPISCLYKYKLEGFDKDWIDAKYIRNATYTNLSPGKYTFRVIASNNHNVWNNVGTSIEIVIYPPFWQTLWFKILSVLFVLGIIYLGIYLKIFLMRKKQIELEKLVTLRTAELISRQAIIEVQTAELKAYTENLQQTNEKLIENQKLIERQSNELSDTNEKLHQSNASKDKFFSIIAHDLRSPFNSIQGFSELLINNVTNRCISEEKVLRYLSLIHASSRNAYTLLVNLLEWSRSQIGIMSFQLDYYNISLMVDDTINLMEGQANNKNITILKNVDMDTLVYCDENMIKTILRNLLSNAIKYTPQNGSVLIETCEMKSEMKISVIDTGVGIPQNRISKLFDIETNTSTKGTENESGTGLGLVLCKEFIERHKGKIWVESELEKGSSFIFTLPFVEI